MPRHETTGEVRKDSLGNYSTRIRAFGRREPFDLPTCTDDPTAEDRSTLLAKIAKQLKLAGANEARSLEALRLVAAASERSLNNALTVAEELLGGQIPAGTGVPEAPTFETVAKEWTSGDLHTRFPDHVAKLKASLATVKQRLDKGILPVIGNVRVTEITRAHCDDVMRKLPIPKGKTELSRETRRQYAGLVNRVLNLAELAGYIDRNPLPRGWLPKVGPQKRFPVLYPEEDRTLLACEEVPLAYRVLYGFLHREGMRRGEAAALQWSDLDLDNETVSLDENKTDHPRWWRLSEGVAETLEAWKAFRTRELGGEPNPEDPVFTDEHGRPLSPDHMAETVRAHLKKAGLTRADLYSTGPLKGAFGLHCFRRSFVTISLANGRNEDFVRQRTGHKSTQLLKYRQTAKALAELELGELDPLSLEQLDCPGIAPGNPTRRWRNGRRASLRC